MSRGQPALLQFKHKQSLLDFIYFEDKMLSLALYQNEIHEQWWLNWYGEGHVTCPKTLCLSSDYW